MRHWMKQLADHYRALRKRYPEDTLVLVTDIDGTILDMRQMVCDVLKSYDREHNTPYFRRLDPTQITTHENQVLEWLRAYGLTQTVGDQVHAWYMEKRWDSEAIVAMHAPYRGVIEVLRWFQLQPRTEVALLTGRPEQLRADTLRCMEALGTPHRVHFQSDLLFMNPEGWEQNVSNNKARGIEQLRARGFRPFAFIDNEPANLQSVSRADADNEILLLHADTIFESKRSIAPPHAVRGHDYRVDKLVEREGALPDRVALAWHGANSPESFALALRARVQWIEIDVRHEPTLAEPIVRTRALEEHPWQEGEEPFLLRHALKLAESGDKGIKLDIKGNYPLLEPVIDAVEKTAGTVPLWFNARLEDIGREGFVALRKKFPDAVLQCPADWLVPFVFADPDTASHLAAQIVSWGVDRFSFVWDPKRNGLVIDFMEQRGWQTNLYRVPDLESFLHAAMLLPTSITTSFRAARRLL